MRAQTGVAASCSANWAFRWNSPVIWTPATPPTDAKKASPIAIGFSDFPGATPMRDRMASSHRSFDSKAVRFSIACSFGSLRIKSCCVCCTSKRRRVGTRNARRPRCCLARSTGRVDKFTSLARICSRRFRVSGTSSILVDQSSRSASSSCKFDISSARLRALAASASASCHVSSASGSLHRALTASSSLIALW